MSGTDSSDAQSTGTTGGDGSAQNREGIGITTFLTSVGAAVAIAAVQTLIFLLLRNKLARI